jgi:cbb3-type cytochrome oxidase subunit 3
MDFLTTVFAQDAGSINLTPTQNTTLSTFTIPSIIQWAVTIVLIIAGVIFFFMLIIGGVRWILSGGDKANTESARNQITAALIGLIIVFAAWAIALLLQNVFQVNILNVTIPVIPAG